jgi:hypothetical protein
MTRRANRTLLQRMGFVPARPTRSELAKSRKEFKFRVRQKRKEFGDEMVRLRKSARSGRTRSTRRLEKLFHEVYGREPNPREIAGMIGGNRMATKKRKSKKKKNSRKGVMPAGLRKYWAKLRGKKNPRRKRNAKSRPFIGPDGKVWHSSGKGRPRKKKKQNPRVRTRTIVKYKYRTRKVKVYPKRRRRARKSNPRVKRTIRIQAPPGLGPKGLRRFRAMAAKAYGAPARIVKR